MGFTRRGHIKYEFIALSAFIALIALSCTNPFAPKLADYEGDAPLLGDQRTVEGLFKNFSYSYKMKDTVVYGKLLSEDFTFIYRSYDSEPVSDAAWGRDVDMITTYRLFQATQRLDLVWNEINMIVGDSITQSISRSFTLDVVFDPSDRFQLQGKAHIKIERERPDDPWKITQWRDETNN